MCVLIPTELPDRPPGERGLREFLAAKEAAGWERAALAEYCGVSSRRVYSVVEGLQTEVEVDTADKVYLAFGLTVSQVYDGVSFGPAGLEPERCGHHHAKGVCRRPVGHEGQCRAASRRRWWGANPDPAPDPFDVLAGGFCWSRHPGKKARCTRPFGHEGRCDGKGHRWAHPDRPDESVGGMPLRPVPDGVCWSKHPAYGHRCKLPAGHDGACAAGERSWAHPDRVAA